MAVSTPPPYESFTVLLDDPTVQPRLGFNVYADAFAQVIEHSRPQFAVGIFGDWGSGKTTLMRAIERRVAAKPDLMLPVWFNAWRYEREEHLIIPLLDNLREALEAWSKANSDAGKRVKKAAAMFGHAARALLSGISIQGGVTVVQGTLDLGKVMESTGPEDKAASFYHAAFSEMREAIETFVADGPRRIVVFVDDLDRCLPTNALQVLESMKLFFDFTGFVFVVGLDQGVIERSVEAKYQSAGTQQTQVVIQQPRTTPDADGVAEGAILRAPGLRSSGGDAPPINGADYIKKLFQLPFSLPHLGVAQLGDLIDALEATETLPTAQAKDLRSIVSPHLQYLSDRDALNPREIKRFINGYVLQMKLLSPRLGFVSPDAVLAIQLMAFRPDWRALYEVMTDEPDEFVEEVKREIEPYRATPFSVGEEEVPVPESFVSYLRKEGKALLHESSLRSYVSSAEQTQTTNPGPRLASQAVRRLRRFLSGAAEVVVDPARIASATSDIAQLRDALSGSSRSVFPPLLEEALTLTDSLERSVKGLGSAEEALENEPNRSRVSARRSSA
jgi:hypothetical protein